MSDASVVVDVVPGIMHRVRLMRGSAVEVRAHLFLASCAETYVHDHIADFVSVCLAGEYLHQTWNVEPPADPGDVFVQLDRSGSDLRSRRVVPGRVVKGLSHVHFPGSVYVIPSSQLHTVQAHAAAGPACTLTFRSRLRGELSRVLTVAPGGRPEAFQGDPLREDELNSPAPVAVGAATRRRLIAHFVAQLAALSKHAPDPTPRRLCLAGAKDCRDGDPAAAAAAAGAGTSPAPSSTSSVSSSSTSSDAVDPATASVFAPSRAWSLRASAAPTAPRPSLPSRGLTV